jgi:hypothetical protein
MLRSMFVVGLFLAVLVLLTFRTTPSDPVQEIALGPQVTAARLTAPFPVLVPDGLGEGWRPTSARVTEQDGAATWHIGYVTPDGEYAALEQSDGPAEPFVAGFAPQATPAGEVIIGGTSWVRLESRGGEERTLLHATGDVPTLVTGTAGYAELERLAAALRPA